MPATRSWGGTWREPSIASVSPDGETLCLVRKGRILLTRRDGSIIREIASLPSNSVRATISRDGDRVRYEAAGPHEGAPWIWEVPVEGAPARPLWPGRRGRWTPDGSHFLFDRFDETENRDDLHVAAEGRFPWSSPGDPMRLTAGPLSFYSAGSAPDGALLFAWGVRRRAEILRHDAETGRFESYLGGHSAGYVDASPAGDWLAWVSYPDETLWKSRPDGADRLQLTGPGWRVHLPRWSPDGRQIVFAGRGPGEVGLGLFLINPGGGEPESLVPWDARTGSLWDPCWLPSAESVVYSSFGRGPSQRAGLSTEGTHPRGIYRVQLGSREISRLPGSEHLVYPKCSSRGEILAIDFSSEAGPLFHYRVGSVAGETWESIGRWPRAYPNWSRDGAAIIALDQEKHRIERFWRQTERLEVLADASEIQTGSWFNADWTGLSPDESPLVMHDRSTRDLYALEWEAP